MWREFAKVIRRSIPCASVDLTLENSPHSRDVAVADTTSLLEGRCSIHLSYGRVPTIVADQSPGALRERWQSVLPRSVDKFYEVA